MKKIVAILTVLILSSCEVAFVEDISSETIVLIAPANDSEILAGNLSFHWGGVSEAESYQLQIATPTFEMATQVVLDTVVSSVSFEKELTVGEYQWRVKGMNSQYETGFSTNSFTVN